MGMAAIGAAMHFSYSDMLEMELEEFRAFVAIAEKMREA